MQGQGILAGASAASVGDALESHEIEELIAGTLRDLGHPRITGVQTYTERGSERTGVYVADTDGSEGFIQVVS